VDRLDALEERIRVLEARHQPLNSAELRAMYSGPIALVINSAVCKALADAGALQADQFIAHLQVGLSALQGDPVLRQQALDELKQLSLHLQPPAVQRPQ
jgi:hypothetical protein